MSLSAVLGTGLVSIYGYGTNISTVSGIVVPNDSFFFGVIDQTWSSLSSNVSVGQSVLFQEKDVLTRIIYNNQAYTLIPENKSILIELTPP